MVIGYVRACVRAYLQGRWGKDILPSLDIIELFFLVQEDKQKTQLSNMWNH